MITKRDREIIDFINNFGCITIKQCGDLFFTNNKSCYDGARLRLKKIEKTKSYIKHMFNAETKEKIYIPINSKAKNFRKHKLLTIDYIVALKRMGAKFARLELEYDFGGVKPDAFLIFEFNKKIYFELVEVQLSHKLVDINRYNLVKNKIAEETKKKRPAIIIIQNTRYDYNKDNATGFNVIKLNTKLEELAKVVIEDKK